jgi:hypothetical protein
LSLSERNLQTKLDFGKIVRYFGLLVRRHTFLFCFVFLRCGDETKGPGHARQMLYYRATYLALFFIFIFMWKKCPKLLKNCYFLCFLMLFFLELCGHPLKYGCLPFRTLTLEEMGEGDGKA